MMKQNTAAIIPKRGEAIYSATLRKNALNTIRPVLQEKKAKTMLTKKGNKMKHFCSLHKLFYTKNE